MQVYNTASRDLKSGARLMLVDSARAHACEGLPRRIRPSSSQNVDLGCTPCVCMLVNGPLMTTVPNTISHVDCVNIWTAC